jgi:hypothetical protein
LRPLLGPGTEVKTDSSKESVEVSITESLSRSSSPTSSIASSSEFSWVVGMFPVCLKNKSFI